MKVYNKKEAIEQMNRWSKANIGYLFIIDYKQEKILLESIDRIDASEVLYSFDGFGNSCSFSEGLNEPIKLNCEMPEYSSYRSRFERVRNHICRGNSYLVNLTCKVPITTNQTLDEIYLRSKAKYKLRLKEQFVCFSPEIFVQITNRGVISSYPMKGTIDATLPQAEEQLMNDQKEAAEHATIVDLIRNDLSMVSESVRVEKYRYIDTIETHKGVILQSSSKISGQLPNNYDEHIGDILFRLLPAGSITGAPKKKTMQIIAEAEGYEREFYTGIMGCYRNKTLDSAVMIRFIEKKEDGLYFKSGGGITAKSNCESEYNEILQKIYVPIH